MSEKKTQSEREFDCLNKYGYHDYESRIDPRSGGYMRCKRCGKVVDGECDD